LAALAGTALAVVDRGQDSGPGPAGPPNGVEHARAHPVADAPPGATGRPIRAAAGSIVYKQTKPRLVEPGLTPVDVGKCPRRTVAISGYYWYDLPAGQKLRDPVVTDVGGTPWGKTSRKWLFYSSVPQSGAGVENVVYGIICTKVPG
jgi:hypothetical protein